MRDSAPQIEPSAAEDATGLDVISRYERIAAQAAPERIFTEGGDAKTATAEFARTVSRLTEMQAAAYLQSEKPQR